MVDIPHKIPFLVFFQTDPAAGKALAARMRAEGEVVVLVRCAAPESFYDTEGCKGLAFTDDVTDDRRAYVTQRFVDDGRIPAPGEPEKKQPEEPPPPLVVPENYSDMKWPELQDLAKKVTDDGKEPRDRAAALDAVKAFLEKTKSSGS